jgi:PAS domain S-box-containing protein
MSLGELLPGDPKHDLAGLIRILNDTHRRIADLTGGKVDAVLDASGSHLLLPKAQEDLRRREAAQRRIAAERKAILDGLPAQVALLDRGGHIVVVNEAWRRFATENGAAPDHALGRDYAAICDVAAAGHEGDTARSVAAAVRTALGGAPEPFTMEYPCHAPGRERWFQLFISPLSDDVHGAVVMHVDVTARKLAEARTEEIKTCLETLVGEANIGILVHRGFRPVMANQELASIFGHRNVDAILGLPDCRVLFDAGEVDRLSPRQGPGGALARPGVRALRGVRADGTGIELECRVFSIRWGSQPADCAMIIDVTDQRGTERKLSQLQRLDAIGRLTGGIAHDFNNLLTVILGNAELLVQRLSGDARLRLVAELTRTAAERGADLTRQLLAFARRQPLDPRATDVHALLAGMHSLLRRTLGEHIEIQRQHGAGLWEARVDPAQLESAILNLCINARDAMPDGGTLCLDLGNVDCDAAPPREDPDIKAGKFLRVAVSDSGFGMDPETASRAFEPFFTTKELGKGSGLGLSMVFGFVKQSGGHVRLSSEPGRGTAVRLYLPRAEALGEPAEQRGAAPSQAKPGAEHILLVEDDDLVREHLADQLESLGYRVSSAASGPEALRLLGGAPAIDLVLTDIVMPGGMNGWQLAEAAQRLCPGLRFVFTSGYDEGGVGDRPALAAEAPLLQKPYQAKELALRIRMVLDEERRS